MGAQNTGENMAELYSCRKLTIGELFCRKNPPIEVPEWQRGFSWGTLEVECLWLDLMAFSNRYEGVILDRQEYNLGPIVLALQPDLRILLDGQHRFAAAVILLSVMRDHMRGYSREAADYLQDEYIVSRDKSTGRSVYSLTLSRADREFFRREVQDEDPSGRRASEPQIESHRLIWSARNRIHDRFQRQWTARGGRAQAFGWAQRILLVLMKHVTVKVSTSLWSPSMILPNARFPQRQSEAAQSRVATEPPVESSAAQSLSAGAGE
jgi:hypothetical protein